jgi:hypothetical protein
MARGIHATRVPHVRQMILDGVLHAIECPACGTITDVPAEVAYTDFDRSQWVRVARPHELAAWARVEADTLAQFERLMARGPDFVATIANRFRVRVVFDLDELRERLVIWDAGLDDAIVECVKLASVRERPDLAAPEHRIRVRAIAGGTLHLASAPMATPKADRVAWTAAPRAVAAVAEARAEWQAQFPELFQNGFVSVDRYLLDRASDL